MSGCLSDEALAAWSTEALPAGERAHGLLHAEGCDRCRIAIAHLIGGVPSKIARAERAAGEGAQLGRYQLAGPLGAGGMGVVFRGRDPLLGRDVAIKMMNAALVDPSDRSRMLREAQAMARVSHPNVVTVLELGEAGDEVFVVMELVDGLPLQRWLAEPRSATSKIAVALGVGRGLAAIHAAGLLHRDIKPDNILVKRDGTPVVVDFGLAQAAARPTSALGSSERAGTPRYVAPEVLAGHPASPASDQFQWWAIVEDALAGLPLLRTPAVVRAVTRGRDLDPTQRFRDLDDAIAALERALEVRPRRNRRLAAAAVLLAVAAGAGGMVWWASAPDGTDACAPLAPKGWSVAVRAAVEHDLLAAGIPPGRVLASLDATAATTTSLRARACREDAAGGAARAEGVRRQVCIDETWAATRTAVEDLLTPSSAKVRAALDDLSEVAPITRCASGLLPAVPSRLPLGPAQIYAGLVEQVQAIEGAAQLPSTTRVTRLRALAPTIGKFAYPPLTARWHWAVAHALSDARDVVGSAREYALAAETALAGGDDNVYVRALILELQLLPSSASADHAEALERQASAGAARLGNPQIEAQLLLARANRAMERAEGKAARTLLAEADQLYARTSVHAHAQHVGILQTLGALSLELGEFEVADGYLDRMVTLAGERYTRTDAPYWEARTARATSYVFRGQLDRAETELRTATAGLESTSPDSAQVGISRAYLCATMLAKVELERARAECVASVRATRAAVGVDSAGLVWPLTLSGQVELQAGAPAAALAFLEHAGALVDAGSAPPVEATTARTYLAIARLAAHQDSAARTLATRVAPELAGPEFAEARRDFIRAFPALAAIATPR